MERRKEVLGWLLAAVVVLGCLSCATAQTDSSSGSLSSGSDSVDPNDSHYCDFRGDALLHGQSMRIDPCTVCSCDNGTTECIIESCPAEAGCLPDEMVTIEGLCCQVCPYKMIVEDTHNLYAKTLDFTEGEIKSIRFNLEIEVNKKLTSRVVRGNGLWKLSAWISRNEDGSGQKYSFRDQIFEEEHAAQEFLKPEYPPWKWKKVLYDVDFKGGTCDDYKYFCVKFDEGDEPVPAYELDFTFRVKDDEESRLIDCVPLGECKASTVLTAEELDWDLDPTGNPIYGVETPFSLDVSVRFNPETTDQRGENQWRVPSKHKNVLKTLRKCFQLCFDDVLIKR